MRDLSHRPRLFLILAAVALIVALTAGGARSQDEDRYVQYNEGSRLYQQYCSNCHGPEGKGDGRIAGLLKVPPADLTQLTDAEGNFPAEQVHKVIDGTEGLLIHGSREMPIWGTVFRDVEGSGPEDEETAREKIEALVVYLETIQEPPA